MAKGYASRFDAEAGQDAISPPSMVRRGPLRLVLKRISWPVPHHKSTPKSGRRRRSRKAANVGSRGRVSGGGLSRNRIVVGAGIRNPSRQPSLMRAMYASVNDQCGASITGLLGEAETDCHGDLNLG